MTTALEVPKLRDTRGLGARIRADLEASILSGQRSPGDRVPSERELTAAYACSRMTVHKALTALADAGLIVRRRGAGSHVASPPMARAMMEIQDLAEEAQRLGKSYSHRVTLRRREPAVSTRGLAAGFAVDVALLRICLIHSFDGIPHAHEDRLISLQLAPAAEHADFAGTSPTDWLVRHVPWTDAEHVIYAVNANANVARRLEIPLHAACLVLERRTWQQGEMVTRVSMTYPGARQKMVGRFSPAKGLI